MNDPMVCSICREVSCPHACEKIRESEWIRRRRANDLVMLQQSGVELTLAERLAGLPEAVLEWYMTTENYFLPEEKRELAYKWCGVSWQEVLVFDGPEVRLRGPISSILPLPLTSDYRRLEAAEAIAKDLEEREAGR